MWSAIIAGVATTVAVLYMQGPIVALALTAASSLALLVAMRIGEHRTSTTRPAHPQLRAVGGSTEDTLTFPPLQKEAS